MLKDIQEKNRCVELYLEYTTLLLMNDEFHRKVITYEEFEDTVYPKYIDCIRRNKSQDDNHMFDAFVYTLKAETNYSARAQASALTLGKGDAFNHVPGHQDHLD